MNDEQTDRLINQLSKLTEQLDMIEGNTNNLTYLQNRQHDHFIDTQGLQSGIDSISRRLDPIIPGGADPYGDFAGFKQEDIKDVVHENGTTVLVLNRGDSFQLKFIDAHNNVFCVDDPKLRLLTALYERHAYRRVSEEMTPRNDHGTEAGGADGAPA